MSSRISTRKRTQAVDQVELRANHSAAKKKKTKERTAFNDRANAPVDSGWRLVLKILFGVDDEEELVELLVEVDPHGKCVASALNHTSHLHSSQLCVPCSQRIMLAARSAVRLGRLAMVLQLAAHESSRCP